MLNYAWSRCVKTERKKYTIQSCKTAFFITATIESKPEHKLKQRASRLITVCPNNGIHLIKELQFSHPRTWYSVSSTTASLLWWNSYEWPCFSNDEMNLIMFKHLNTTYLLLLCWSTMTSIKNNSLPAHFSYLTFNQIHHSCCRT